MNDIIKIESIKQFIEIANKARDKSERDSVARYKAKFSEQLKDACRLTLDDIADPRDLWKTTRIYCIPRAEGSVMLCPVRITYSNKEHDFVWVPFDEDLQKTQGRVDEMACDLFFSSSVDTGMLGEGGIVWHSATSRDQANSGCYSDTR